MRIIKDMVKNMYTLFIFGYIYKVLNEDHNLVLARSIILSTFAFPPPTTSPRTSPAGSITLNVGIAWTPYAAAASAAISTSTLAKGTPFVLACSTRYGAMALHGPHHLNKSKSTWRGNQRE